MTLFLLQVNHFNTRVKHIQKYNIVYLTSLLYIIEELFTVYNFITLILSIFMLKKCLVIIYFYNYLVQTNYI